MTDEKICGEPCTVEIKAATEETPAVLCGVPCDKAPDHEARTHAHSPSLDPQCGRHSWKPPHPIRAWLDHVLPSAESVKMIEGMDQAILGIAQRPEMGLVLAYDMPTVAAILLRDKTENEAREIVLEEIFPDLKGETAPVFIMFAPDTVRGDW